MLEVGFLKMKLMHLRQFRWKLSRKLRTTNRRNKRRRGMLQWIKQLKSQDLKPINLIIETNKTKCIQNPFDPCLILSLPGFLSKGLI